MVTASFEHRVRGGLWTGSFRVSLTMMARVEMDWSRRHDHDVFEVYEWKKWDHMSVHI